MTLGNLGGFGTVFPRRRLHFSVLRVNMAEFPPETTNRTHPRGNTEENPRRMPLPAPIGRCGTTNETIKIRYIMKKFLVMAALFLGAIAAGNSAKAQVKFSADFECGSMEKVELVSQETKNGKETFR